MSQALAERPILQTGTLARLAVPAGAEPAGVPHRRAGAGARTRRARHQRWIRSSHGRDLTRRAGTLTPLFAPGCWGEPADVRGRLADIGASWRTGACSTAAYRMRARPLRLDPPLRGWVLGEENALGADARMRRVLRTDAPGQAQPDPRTDAARAVKLVAALQGLRSPAMAAIAGLPPSRGLAGALIEMGGFGSRPESHSHRSCGRSRPRRDRGRGNGDPPRALGPALRAIRSRSTRARKRETVTRLRASFSARSGTTGTPAAVITTDAARLVRLLGHCHVHDRTRGHSGDRTRIAAALRAAAVKADAPLSHDAARDRLRPAIRADPRQPRARPRGSRRAACPPPARRNRITSSRRLRRSRRRRLVQPRAAHRADVRSCSTTSVLPARPQTSARRARGQRPLRGQGLLDGWNFRAQLPYGRGVTAPLPRAERDGQDHGRARGGTEARRVQILHASTFSRVVSKFVGDTERTRGRGVPRRRIVGRGPAYRLKPKPSSAAQRSTIARDQLATKHRGRLSLAAHGGKRSRGLAILTTNLCQNVDAAFLRRLRFIVDFPRPDVVARERSGAVALPARSTSSTMSPSANWRAGSTSPGGHVRQITLRAAFVAAAAGTRIRLAHAACACRAEFARLGLPPVELDDETEEPHEAPMRSSASLQAQLKARLRRERSTDAGDPGAVFIGPLERSRRERRLADPLPLPHRAQREPAQPRPSHVPSDNPSPASSTSSHEFPAAQGCTTSLRCGTRRGSRRTKAAY